MASLVVSIIAILISFSALLGSLWTTYFNTVRVTHELFAVVTFADWPLPDGKLLRTLGSDGFGFDVSIINNGNRSETILDVVFCQEIANGLSFSASGHPTILKPGDVVVFHLEKPLLSVLQSARVSGMAWTGFGFFARYILPNGNSQAEFMRVGRVRLSPGSEPTNPVGQAELEPKTRFDLMKRTSQPF